VEIDTFQIEHSFPGIDTSTLEFTFSVSPELDYERNLIFSLPAELVNADTFACGIV
jgi:hypothetical protein